MQTTDQKIYIQKENGTRQLFSPEKLKRSLMKAGATEHVADGIVTNIIHEITEHDLYEPTAGDIYKKAFHHLKEHAIPAAARYSLRRSLMEFGPTGFPFEEYIGQLFQALGYTTLIDQTVFGSCVPHEIDVVAWNDTQLLMVEVKYHNEPAGKTDLKVALYVKARYDDLRENMYDYGGKKRKLDEGWLVTNTKFTDTAITYGTCKDLKMLSWSYPIEGNLHDLIQQTKLQPVTCLMSLTSAEKKTLIDHKIALCKTIHENSSALLELGFEQAKIVKIMEEIDIILGY